MENLQPQLKGASSLAGPGKNCTPGRARWAQHHPYPDWTLQQSQAAVRVRRTGALETVRTGWSVDDDGRARNAVEPSS